MFILTFEMKISSATQTQNFSDFTHFCVCMWVRMDVREVSASELQINVWLRLNEYTKLNYIHIHEQGKKAENILFDEVKTF